MPMSQDWSIISFCIEDFSIYQTCMVMHGALWLHWFSAMGLIAMETDYNDESSAWLQELINYNRSQARVRYMLCLFIVQISICFD